MKIYRLCAVATLATMTCGSFAHAQSKAQTPTGTAAAETTAADRPSREDVLKMFAAMHVQKQMDQMINLMSAEAKQQLQSSLKQGSQLSAQDQARIEASTAGAANVYPVSEMMDDMVPVYQRHMTKADVNAIVAFYASPAGQHLLEESPAMMKEALGTVMPKANARVQAYVEKTMKDLGTTPASGDSSPAAAGGPAASTPPSSTTPPK